MFKDFNLLTNIDKKYDICIVGSGPAGVTLASKMAEQGVTVALLEAGDLEYSEESQRVYECESIGHEAWPRHTRLRYFGGTSNHWSGRCRPFDESDFYNRSINGLPGWPIRYDTLEPYLKEAMSILDLKPEKGFTAINTNDLKEHFYPDAFAKSPPTRFNSKYIEQVRTSKNIDCYLNANATDLTLNETLELTESIEISNYKGQKNKILANRFILCLGGIETPRFLLNCNKQVSSGIGNSHEMVGRCFMEHLNVPIGTFLYEDMERTSSLQFYSDDDFCKSAEIGKSNITFGIIQKVKSYGRTHAIKTFFKNIACNMDIDRKVQFISDFKCPGIGNIGTLIEQSPDIESRVMLSNQLDNFGLKKAKFDWKINEFDNKTIRYTAIEMAKQFSLSGLGAIRLADFILDNNIDIRYSHHAHHMGTTRMSADPRFGVVDSNLKVHGIGNLYIAGSGVFSTGGACNPTMPIIQLCLRLADHLNSQTI